MAAPASVLSALADVAVDGATVAGAVLIALVGMRAWKIMRQGIDDEIYGEAMERTEYQYTREEIEDGFLDSRGNLYSSEEERDEVEGRYSAEEDYRSAVIAWEKEQGDDASFREAGGWKDDQYGSSRTV